MGQELVKSASPTQHASSGHRYGRRHAFVGFRPDRAAPDGETAAATPPATPPASPDPAPTPPDLISTSPARRGRHERDLRSRRSPRPAGGRCGSDDDPSLPAGKRGSRRSARGGAARDAAGGAASAASAAAAVAVTGGDVAKVRGKRGKRSRSSNEDCEVADLERVVGAAVAAAAASSGGRPQQEAGSGREATGGKGKGCGRAAGRCAEARIRRVGGDARSDRAVRRSRGQFRGAREDISSRETSSSSGSGTSGREARNGTEDARRKSRREGRVVGNGSGGERFVGGEQRGNSKRSNGEAGHCDREARSSSGEVRSKSREGNTRRKKRSNAGLISSGKQARGSEEARSSRGEQSDEDDESGREARSHSGEVGCSGWEGRSRRKARSSGRKNTTVEDPGSVGKMRSSRGEARSSCGEARSRGEADLDSSGSMFSLLRPSVLISGEWDGGSSGEDGSSRMDANGSGWETPFCSDQDLTFLGGESSASSIPCMDIDYENYDDDDGDDDLIDDGYVVLDDSDGDDSGFLFTVDGYHSALRTAGPPSSSGASLEELFVGDVSVGEAAAASAAATLAASDDDDDEDVWWTEIRDIIEENWRNMLEQSSSSSSWMLHQMELWPSGDEGDDESDGGAAGTSGAGDDDAYASEGETPSYSPDASTSSSEFVSDFSAMLESVNPGQDSSFSLEDSLLTLLENATADLLALIGNVGVLQGQPAPASSSRISSLPVSFIKDSAAVEQSCTICCSEFARGDSATALPCRHLFHTACIERWLAKAATCPVCRYHVVEEGAAAAPSPPPSRGGSGQRL